jgi:hypothetical protein
VTGLLVCSWRLARPRIVSTIVIIVLLAAAGGATMAAAAGARRTQSAYPRLLEATHDADVEVSAVVDPLALDDLDLDRVPGIANAGLIRGYGVFADDAGQPNFDLGYFATAPVHEVAYREIGAPLVVAGRLPDPGRADEVLVAENAGFRVGDPMRGYLFQFDELGAKLTQLEAEQREPTQADIDEVVTPIDLRVVGLARFTFQVSSTEDATTEPALVLTPAFVAAHPHRQSYTSLQVDLDDPRAGLESFQIALREQLPDAGLGFATSAAARARVGASTSPFVTTLALFALILGLTAALVLGQSVVRQVLADATELPVLRALGMTAPQLRAILLVRWVAAGVVAAGLAIGGSVALSGRFPIGPARQSEPDPGLLLDRWVVAAGGAAIVVLTVSSALIGGHWALRRARAVARSAPSRTRRAQADRLASLGLPPPVVTGVHAALQSPPTGGASPAATIVGVVIALASVTAALTFGSSLDRLVDEPARYGWTWDGMIETYEGGLDDRLTELIEHDVDIAAYSTGARGTVTIEGRPVFAAGLGRGRGDVGLEALRGRLPAGPREIALGRTARRSVGAEIGDEVRATTVDGRVIRLRVVGEALVPALNGTGSEGVSEGAIMTLEGLGDVAGLAPSFVLVDVAAGDTEARLDAIRKRYEAGASLLIDKQPADIRSFDQVRDVPLLLAGLLGLLGAGVLAHALLTAVASRKRELAILKVIGFTRRALSATVAAQASTLACLAVIIGIPLGLVTGRWAWFGFIDGVGVESAPVIPGAAVALTAIVAFMIANLIAMIPAERARRTRASESLTAEQHQ